MKSLTAEKVKDGWVVKITHTHHLHSESDVRKLARQEGLRVVDLKTEGRIFAE